MITFFTNRYPLKNEVKMIKKRSKWNFEFWKAHFLEVSLQPKAMYVVKVNFVVKILEGKVIQDLHVYFSVNL